MKISSRALNKNEIFCCSKNDVKNVFGDSEITVNFGKYGGRNFESDSRFYKGPQLKGKIIASLAVHNRDGQIGAEACIGQSLDFYVLKDEEFSAEAHAEFTKKILPKMYNGYISHLNGNPGDISGTYYFRVELFNNEYLIHEGIE